MPTSLTPYLHVGATPAQSVDNLHCWLDNVAGRLSGPDCLVHNMEHVREKGLFHCMKSDLHALFEAEVSRYSSWSSECHQNNISAGSYYSVESGGMGSLLMMVNKKLGPFLN